MHIPKTFDQKDSIKVKEIIRSHPFATLVCNSTSGLEADHIPFILTQSNGQDVLRAHIAKANPLWKNVEDKSPALVIFNGPNCYVSPNYYPSKKENGKAVPTWNYVTVHAKGYVSFIHDEQWILQMIDQLTTQQEATQPEPWSTSDAPNEYIQRMLKAVVGIEIQVSSIEGQWKLSQNQPDQNKLGVISGLSQETNSQSINVASLVRQLVDAKPD